jgi:hypothetical protein
MVFRKCDNIACRFDASKLCKKHDTIFFHWLCSCASVQSHSMDCTRYYDRYDCGLFYPKTHLLAYFSSIFLFKKSINDLAPLKLTPREHDAPPTCPALPPSFRLRHWGYKLIRFYYRILDIAAKYSNYLRPKIHFRWQELNLTKEKKQKNVISCLKASFKTKNKNPGPKIHFRWF